MHIACPNAGEVIQGFALAVKKGITYNVSLRVRYETPNFWRTRRVLIVWLPMQ
jgi:pyruvate/2-oxoglutarate dehydrogenase complex dihydrolipoamide dehydrogenase (E3) component